MSWKSAFTEHPASVGETYVAHMHCAFGFALQMLIGGAACLVHAVFPFLFQRTGSATIERLHDRMIMNRRRPGMSPTRQATLSAAE